MKVVTGEDLARARNRARLTQTQLAARLGCSRRTVAAYEATPVLSNATIGKLGDTLGDLVADRPRVTLTPLTSTLTEATDLELVAELARRLASRQPQQRTES